ncbi:hypothetical protein DL768_003305 [Monosporascus sp. mg162]|nr:hypothetical protein DL768_003305 [Monosporascus sp. mg162]
MVGKLGFLLGLSLFLTSAVSAALATNAAEEYDYIVVGSGPGGGPLAVNLAKANYSVLLLEAGDDAFQGGGSYPPAITWDFFVKHYDDEERTLQYYRLTHRLPRWLLLALKLDAVVTECSSFHMNPHRLIRLISSSEEMRRHSVAIEKNNYLPEGTPGHGFNGYFPTSMATGNVEGPLGAVLEAAAEALGQDPSEVSTHLVEETLATNQHPLALQMNTFVSRILFANSTKSGSKPRATGVEVIKGKSVYKADPRNTGTRGEVATVTARKEVILAGGAFNSPQTLMVAGDPPAGLGIAVTVIKTDPRVYGEWDIFFRHDQYVFRGFWPGKHSNPDLATDPPNAYGIALVKMHPQNTAGRVRLRSADPLDTPDINFKLYVEGADVDVGAIKDTIAWARRIYNATVAPYGPLRTTEPPCSDVDPADGRCNTDEDEEWIYAQTFGHHPTSTCRIGADGDPMAVLDSSSACTASTGCALWTPVLSRASRASSLSSPLS